MHAARYAVTDLNDGFVVAINIDAKPGEADAVAAIAQQLINPTMAEPGVKLFLPYRSPTNPAQFFIFELYRNADGWARHQETDHFKSAIKELLPRVSRRERVPSLPFATL